MIKKRLGWLFAFLGCMGTLLALPFIAAFVLYSRSSPSPLLPVEDRAIQRVHVVLADIRNTSLNSLATSVTNFPDCYTFLYENLQQHNQYELILKAAFDPNDPRFPVYANGSWDASVEVHFPDGQAVEIYLYGGTWENCKIINDMTSPIPVTPLLK
jgi:hypothetical protein